MKSLVWLQKFSKCTFNSGQMATLSLRAFFNLIQQLDLLLFNHPLLWKALRWTINSVPIIKKKKSPIQMVEVIHLKKAAAGS